MGMPFMDLAEQWTATDDPEYRHGREPRGPGKLPARLALPPAAAARRHWWTGLAGHAATLALCILVLAAGLFVVGPLLPRWAPPRPAGVPGVVTAPTATPQATPEDLLYITIPPELLPQGARITSEFSYLTMPAGSKGRWQGLARVDWRGLRMHYVIDGSLVIRADDAAWVWQAGAQGTPEEAPAGTEVELGPGDTWMARNETAYEIRNTTGAPTQFLSWILANIADPNNAYIYLEPGPWTIDFTDPLPPGIVAPAAATLRIRQLELPVAGRLPATPGAILQQGVRPPTNTAGTPVIDPSLGTLRNGALVNLSRKPITTYALSLEPVEGTAGAPQAGTPASREDPAP